MDQQRWALYSRWLDSDHSEVRANTVICLIHQANYLLDQQIAALEKQFVTEGGYSERLAAARLAERTRHKDRSNLKKSAARTKKPASAGDSPKRAFVIFWW